MRKPKKGIDKSKNITRISMQICKEERNYTFPIFDSKITEFVTIEEEI